MGIITIDQFRSSGIDCEDIGSKIPGQGLEGRIGRVYLDELHIEHWRDGRDGKAPPAGPTWLLTLGNMQYDGALADMELELYRWALSDNHLVTDRRPTGVMREFSDFSAFDIPLPLLDTGWTDYSWHNDAMPFFVHEPSGVGVWVNYADQDERETPERFIAEAMEWDRTTASWMHKYRGNLPVLFSTDDEAVLLSSLPNFIELRAIAHAFANSVEEQCAVRIEGEHLDRWVAIRLRNADPAYSGSCATHDFFDANVLMADAFEKTMGRPFLTDSEPSREDVTLRNMAWEIARAERLTADVSKP